jgi:cell division septal protein FtsQ
MIGSPGALLHMAGATAWHASKLISLALLLCVVATVAYLQSDLRWFIYREQVRIEGPTYLNIDELYKAAGVDSWNIFWIRPQAVQARVMAAPYVKSVTVTISLPNQVHIQVQEEQPVALWVTAEATLWLMPDGTALPVHNEHFNTLPQLVDPLREAQDVTQRTRPAVTPELLSSALLLLQRAPDITQLRFNRDYGLNFNLPGTLTWVYWGDGQHMEQKLTNLAAVEELIRSGEARPQVIDVRFERPYFQ